MIPDILPKHSFFKFCVRRTEKWLNSWKLTYPLEIDGWKMKFPFKMVAFQGTFLRLRGGGSIDTLKQLQVHTSLKFRAHQNDILGGFGPPNWKKYAQVGNKPRKTRISCMKSLLILGSSIHGVSYYFFCD